MGRLTVTYGEPRRVITYPAAPENLSKLLGIDLAVAAALTPDALQEHQLAALMSGAGDFAGGPLVTAISNLSADIAAAADLAPDLLQSHSLVAALDAGAGAGVDLQQDHALASTLSASGTLAGDIDQVAAFDLSATMNATADLAGDITAQAAGNPMQFAVVNYSGSGAAQSITGVGFQPDFILFYKRDAVSEITYIADRVALGTGRLWTPSENDSLWLEFTIDDADAVTSFDADGFTLGSSDRVNTSGYFMAAVCFKMGDQFEVIDKANDGTSGQVVPHNLSTSPIWAVIKQDGERTGEWLYPWTEGGEAASSFGSAKGAETEALQARSASDVTLGNDALWNPSSGSAPLYLFGSENVSGSFHTGTYTGSGGSGNAITGLGFTPSLVLIRAVDGDGVFIIHENMFPDEAIRLDDPGRDASFTMDADGFTVDTGQANRSGDVYRYFAWA
ncbi:DUF7483 domain-containing protein [Dichotomicrobium thermohalophilum]|uniref:DUF7483 domain-containing protein n=1 Tax=Dichotomicrobium thermohalophilum TaxID=933063 RepID=A0A397QAB7_9HYPH|nr:hypothetical protein [Dichotomicrobium thermohalophilum]RIA56755.1 hypothetical protein BXY53_1865 [Dichotomicrobium thermohalophilum]